MRDVFVATTWRERRWLFGRILPVVLMDRAVWYLTLLGCSFLLLSATMAIIAQGPRPVSTILAVAAVGGLLLMTALTIAAMKITGAELVQQLLRLEKCGCCGHPKSTPAGRSERHHPRASRRFTCTECGSSWGGGRADFGDEPYSEAA